MVTRAGTINAGMMMLNEKVKPSSVNSKNPGVMRTAPSSQPMYQSGCDPAVTGEGSYDPYIQIGLIVKSAPIRAVTPNTMKKNPPAFAAYTGYSGYPTTLSLVRPGPGYWVCFCTTSMIRGTVMSARKMPGSSSTWIVKSRGMKSSPGNWPPKAKKLMYEPTTGIARM